MNNVLTRPVKIILDTETTNLPVRNDFTHVRLIQLAYILLDREDNIIEKVMRYVKPDGFKIENSWIHGITTELATEKGLPIREVLSELYSKIITCETLICHNIDFDKNVILAECYRCEREDSTLRSEVRFGPWTNLKDKLEKIQNYCTMLTGGEGRWIKLHNLYKMLYPEKEWNQIHDALDDANITYDCYVKLRSRHNNSLAIASSVN
jgi:DNA polymerase-3 subunit alpha